uniref:Formin homology 2 domain containing 3 n=1 Tax=Oncorhynchus kisutch TaxID=8019 RepID=A0A8C7L4J3_ONCKI
MATFVCRVQFLDDTDPFNSTNFPEPTRPPQYTFREDIPLINQIAGVHRLLKAPHKLDDCALQLSQNGSYLDLESTLAEQRDELEGFQEGGRGKKHSIILRTQLSVRVHACIEKLYNSNGRELRRALFSLKQIFQDDKDLVHEFVVSEGLTCLIKVGAEADQNYQNYILRALGQIMLYVDGMNGLISHNETVQWLYTLVGSKFRLVVKTALKLLLVFVEYTEPNTALLIHAVNTVDTKRGCKLWSNAMEILEEKDGVDTELLVYAMTLINKTLAGLPDQDSFYDVVDCLEEQGMEAMSQRHRSRKGTDLDLMEQEMLWYLHYKQDYLKMISDNIEKAQNGNPYRSILFCLVLFSLPGSEVDVEPSRDLQTRTTSPAPELIVSGPSPEPTEPSSQTPSQTPPAPAEEQAETETQTEKQEVAEVESKQEVLELVELVVDEQTQSKEQEEREEEEEEGKEEERQSGNEVEGEKKVEEEVEVEGEEVEIEDVEVVEMEGERGQAASEEREVEERLVLLSEKERQNEEVNEKDNCSASSISSASSTLEREEREEKVNIIHSTLPPCVCPPLGQCIKEEDVNGQCSKILNSKRFMLDMLYAQNKTAADEDEEKAGETEQTEKCKEGMETSSLEGQEGSSVASLMEVQHLENQGSVRAVAEKFGDLVKSLVSPHELESLEKQQQGELRIKEMDFTDLADEDDLDILDVDSVLMGSSDLMIPPPPPCLSTLPPPPPLGLFGCPPPPPVPGMMPPPPPFMPPGPAQPYPGSPQLSRGTGEPPLFQKKKKTIRLFWNEVRPMDGQYRNHKRCRESLWSKLEPVKVDTSKLEHLFETKSKELPKTAVDGKRQEIIVLDSKRSNAINIGLTVLPPPRTIKTAILNFDEYALNKEGIEKILTMIPTEEEKQRIQDAQLVNPDVPLGSAEQFLLTLSSITELSARLQLWAFKMDYEVTEKEVAEPLQDLKEGMDQLEKNKTLRYILSTLLAIGNFLNGSNAKGFELGYLEKVPEVKDTVHKQSLLHHACSIVVEKFPDSSDLYSEIGAITRSAKVDFDQLQDNLSQMERRCKASWDHLKVIAKHEMKPALKQKMSDFLKDCAERIIILKIVHRRIINRFHAFLLFLGHPAYAVREVSIHHFSKILSEFALEYRTTRERVLQQKQKRANHRERNKTRGKMITHVSVVVHLTGLLMGSGSNDALLLIYRVGQTQTRPQGVRIHRQTDAADEIMERIVRSATQGPRTRTEPRERKRSRANRKSLRRTLKSGLTPEEANALGLSSGSEMAV